jgi:hypothetical protein
LLVISEVDADSSIQFNNLLIVLAAVYRASIGGGGSVDNWHATFLGLRHLPCQVTAVEAEVYFQFCAEGP